MNNIKTINEFVNDSDKLEIVRVDFSGGGDGVDGMYINGELYKHGDDYHNKISYYINAFVDGVRYAGIEVDFKTIKITDRDLIEDISELANEPPKTIKELEGKY